MTIARWLRRATARLRQASIDSARLDCLLLLEHVLQRDRSWLLAHDDESLRPSALTELEGLLARRESHEPVAYLRRQAEFYGRTFTVGPDVLVPRPESESLITLALQLAAHQRLDRIADIGTGSGCLGITLALELPESQLWLTDVYTNVYTIVRHNAISLGAAINWSPGDLTDALPDKQFDLIVANLPYVPDGYPVNRATDHEPRHALYSGKDGLNHYRRLFDQLSARPTPHLIVEALPAQHEPLTHLAMAASYTLADSMGYALRFTRRSP